MSIIDLIVTYWMVFIPLFLVVITILIILARKGHLTKLELFGVGLELNRDAIEQRRAPATFARSDSSEFVSYGESLLKRARRIILIGTGINLIQKDPIFMAVAERAARGECELEIYMANPFSPDIETRLIDEELGTMKPPIGKAGLIQRLVTILRTLEQLKWPSSLSLKLFSQYPTFAMFIMDGDYFVYSYGFSLLGNFSPVQHYRQNIASHAPMIEFLEGQYRSIKAASVDARLVFGLHQGDAVALTQLKAAAVYLVPELTTPLYRFGSKVLGYSLRERHSTDSPWIEWVGSAAEYGFHLTVADVLYFLNQNEIDRLHRELENLASGLRPFRLSNLKVAAGLPNPRSISLSSEDNSGSMETLHHELVFRTYRRAAASNYSLGLAHLDRDSNHNRAHLMIQRYHAPYILNAFKPHFSLLTNVAASKLLETERDVRLLFEEMVPDDHVVIKSVALVTRPSPDARWEIEREVRL